MKNKHGLSRDIPSEIKRSIRQNCGFGCVICGAGIIQYEHVDPEFHEAKNHDPQKMTLLCPQCHAKVTTGFWSKEKVKRAMREPLCLSQGFCREFFDIGHGHPTLRFGGVLLKNCPIPVQVAKKPLFKIEPSEEEGGPFCLSGFFCDSKGSISLEIAQNEWLPSSKNWDVEVKGKAITVREKKGHIHLKLVAKPPEELIVERLKMHFNGYLIEANGDFLKVTDPQGGTNILTRCIADGCSVGIEF